MKSFYDFEAEDVMGVMHRMEEYRGKVVLVVNTATQCGFTPQYDDLQDIYERHQAEGLEILDFPCNQFGNQAPETNEEIVSFCDAKFGITFKHYAKIEVNGENEHPLYKFLKEQKGFEGFGGNVEAAKKVGLMIAEKAKAAGITDVVFDRGGYLYHGRVSELAEGAREGGLKF